MLMQLCWIQQSSGCEPEPPGCGLIHSYVLGSQLLYEGVYDILKGVSSLHKIISVTA